MNIENKVEKFTSLHDFEKFSKHFSKFSTDSIRMAYGALYTKNFVGIFMDAIKGERLRFNEEIFKIISEFEVIEIEKRSSGRIRLSHGAEIIFGANNINYLRGRAINLLRCKDRKVIEVAVNLKAENGDFYIPHYLNP